MNAASISSLPRPLRKAFLASLSEGEARRLLGAWAFWARPDQLPPETAADGVPWITWLLLGGRGAGKTRAGAEWIKAQVESGHARRVALVAETLSDARDVMVEGPSGLRALAWRGARPLYQPSKRRVVFANGACATLFSAEDPESLRGHQFDHAWADELAKWPNGIATWDMLQFGLRLGARPRQVATTTPAPVALVKRLLSEATTAITRASTWANAAHLAPAFLTQILARYEGTRLARQEIEGELLEDTPGALWRYEAIEARRVKAAPPAKRIVVAVDPPVTGGPDADACGIIVAGLGADGEAYVLADRTVQGCGPLAWARAVVNTYGAYMADRVVVEVNQGGDLVTTLLHQVDKSIAVRAVRATRAKHVRAEPVAALYEQGRVHHVGVLPLLEDQMCAFTASGAPGGASPDRVDALVWALTDLLLSEGPGEPRLWRL